MTARELEVTGAFAFTARAFPDDRGHFVSPYEEEAFTEAVGHPFPRVRQSSYSVSRRGALRGVHVTAPPPGQAQYVYCLGGRVLDLVVDTRVGSPTYGRWDAVELSADTFRSVYYPPGVGHAFLALEADTVLCYLLSAGHAPGREFSLQALDPALGLPLPAEPELIRCERDRRAMTWAEAEERGVLPRYADCLLPGATDGRRRALA